MNERLRGALLGLGIGMAVLLLLQLSGILRDAASAEGTTATLWWVLATYAGVGAVVAVGVALGRRDRLIPAIAALLLLLFVSPSLPGEPLPFGPWEIGGDARPLGAGLAIAVVAIGSFVYATVRGSRG